MVLLVELFYQNKIYRAPMADLSATEREEKKCPCPSRRLGGVPTRDAIILGVAKSKIAQGQGKPAPSRDKDK